jgi:hypothetical protein
MVFLFFIFQNNTTFALVRRGGLDKISQPFYVFHTLGAAAAIFCFFSFQSGNAHGIVFKMAAKIAKYFSLFNRSLHFSW